MRIIIEYDNDQELEEQCRIDSLENERDDYLTQLTHAHLKNVGLQAKVHKLEAELGNTKEVVGRLQTANFGLRKNLAELEVSEGEAQFEVEKLRDELGSRKGLLVILDERGPFLVTER